MLSRKYPSVAWVRLGVKSIHSPRNHLSPGARVLLPGLSPSLSFLKAMTSNNKKHIIDKKLKTRSWEGPGPALSSFLGCLDMVANVLEYVPTTRHAAKCPASMQFLTTVLWQWVPYLHLTETTPTLDSPSHPTSKRQGQDLIAGAAWCWSPCSQLHPRKLTSPGGFPVWQCCCDSRRRWCFIICPRARLIN